MHKYLIQLCLLLAVCSVQAQENNETATTVKKDTAATAAKPPKQKEIKKLEDPLLALPQDLIIRLKKMKPNQLLVIDERFVRNEKRVDDEGVEYEVTVTVRMGFSQDMITGIVKEVPLYLSNGRETNIVHVKIPVKFCCTTPIDTLHKKRHCGKMSELNDFEDNEGCKDWEQKEEATASAAGFGKPGNTTPGTKKKGAPGVSGRTSVGGDDDEDEAAGFGKPVPKQKPTKKGKKGAVINTDDEENATDSTTNKTTLQKPAAKGKEVKKEPAPKPTKKTPFGKKPKKPTAVDDEDEEEDKPEQEIKKDTTKPVVKPIENNKNTKDTTKAIETDVIPEAGTTLPVSDKPKPKTQPAKKPAKTKEAEKPKDEEDEESFGKPVPKEKNKKKPEKDKKNNKKEKEEKPAEPKDSSSVNG